MATVSVRYIVDNVDEAISFYCEHLGFTEQMHPAPTFAMLTRGDLRLVLSAPSSEGGGGRSMLSRWPRPIDRGRFRQAPPVHPPCGSEPGPGTGDHAESCPRTVPSLGFSSGRSGRPTRTRRSTSASG